MLWRCSFVTIQQKELQVTVPCKLWNLQQGNAHDSLQRKKRKKGKLNWGMEKEVEGHIRGQLRISYETGQRPVTQSQY